MLLGPVGGAKLNSANIKRQPPIPTLCPKPSESYLKMSSSLTKNSSFRPRATNGEACSWTYNSAVLTGKDAKLITKSNNLIKCSSKSPGRVKCRREE